MLRGCSSQSLHGKGKQSLGEREGIQTSGREDPWGDPALFALEDKEVSEPQNSLAWPLLQPLFAGSCLSHQDVVTAPEMPPHSSLCLGLPIAISMCVV